MSSSNNLPPDLKDATLKVSHALPNGSAAATLSALGIDTGKTNATLGFQSGNVAARITAPALNTTQLPDTKTMVYDLVSSDSSNLGTPTVVQAGVITQTGAGGAGAAADEKTIRIPPDCKRYLGIKTTNSGAGDASDVDGTLELVF